MIVFSISAMENTPVVKKSGVLMPTFLDLAEEDLFSAEQEISYDLEGKLVSGGVLISGKISTVVSGHCGRCLAPVSLELSAENLQLFFEIEENQELLDVSEDVRAELLLNLPMNPLCSSDCRGLCHVCGTDLNKSSCKCSAEKNPAAPSPWSALDDLKL